MKQPATAGCGEGIVAFTWGPSARLAVDLASGRGDFAASFAITRASRVVWATELSGQPSNS